MTVSENSKTNGFVTLGAELEPLVGWNTDSHDDRCAQDDEGEEKIQEESLSKEEKTQPRLRYMSCFNK